MSITLRTVTLFDVGATRDIVNGEIGNSVDRIFLGGGGVVIIHKYVFVVGISENDLPPESLGYEGKVAGINPFNIHR